MNAKPGSAPVVIVGAGATGGTLALLLLQNGITPLLIEAGTPPTLGSKLLQSYDKRVWALNQASKSILQRIGLWPAISRYCPYQHMHLLHAHGIYDLHLARSDTQSAEPLGYMVENHLIAAAMHHQLQQQLGHHYLVNVQCLHSEQTPTGWRITLSNGELVDTPLLIGADGAQSGVRHAMGTTSHLYNYHQHALSFAAELAAPHDNTASQLFANQHTIAYLPLASLSSPGSANWVSVVWSLPTAEAKALLEGSPLQLQAAINHHTAGRMPTITHTLAAACFPLMASHARHYVQPHTALVGDAAHTVHPMAGQGVNLGLADAAVLADMLVQSHARGQWADFRYLQQYARKRKPYVHAMLHGLTALYNLEQGTSMPATILRDIGFKHVGQNSALVQQALSQADGLAAIAGLTVLS